MLYPVVIVHPKHSMKLEPNPTAPSHHVEFLSTFEGTFRPQQEVHDIHR
jgi:hypothetical protein